MSETNEDRELATEDEIRKAREIYETDDIQIDTPSRVSVAEKGVWVQAWVWLPNE